MLIRLATPEDVPALMAIVRRVVPLMLSAGNFQWNDEYPNAAVFLRDIERGQLWIAEIDGAIAGVTAMTTAEEPDYVQADWDHTQPALVIHRLAVDPETRGAGVARALLAKAEEIALAQNLFILRADTNSENHAAQRLFPSLGYRYASEIPLRARPGQRFFCYEKLLPRK
jgi:ribosomal protein S18 acetylase RimI-like enzyme